MAGTKERQAQSASELAPLTYEQSADRLAKLAAGVLGSRIYHGFISPSGELALLVEAPGIQILTEEAITSGEEAAAVGGKDGAYVGPIIGKTAEAFYAIHYNQHSDLRTKYEEAI